MNGTMYVNSIKLANGEIPSVSNASGRRNNKVIATCIQPQITEFSIECYEHFTPRKIIFIHTGKMPSNNWMKLHGGILERTVQLKKIRKKMIHMKLKER